MQEQLRNAEAQAESIIHKANEDARDIRAAIVQGIVQGERQKVEAAVDAVPFRSDMERETRRLENTIRSSLDSYRDELYKMIYEFRTGLYKHEYTSLCLAYQKLYTFATSTFDKRIETICSELGDGETAEQTQNSLRNLQGLLIKRITSMEAALEKLDLTVFSPKKGEEYNDVCHVAENAEDDGYLEGRIRYCVCPGIRTKEQILEERLVAERSRYQELQQQEAKLEEDLKEYGPAIMEALTSHIQMLRDQLSDAKKEWTKLSGEKRVWERQIEDQKATNAVVAGEIEQQPEELRQLQEAHETLERRLTETIHAQQMCSEEKQKALREQIEEQEPIAQQMTEQYQALKKHAEELEQTIAQLQRAKDEELLRLYPRLTRGLDEIKQSVNDMNAELESLRAEALQFNQHINACADRLESLREWYHVDKTPLQKLEERLGDMTPSENEQLLRTMNPATVSKSYPRRPEGSP